MAFQNGKDFLLYIDTTIPTSIFPPVGVSAAGFGTGGTIPAGTYYYAVTAQDANGETIIVMQDSVTTTGTTSRVVIDWEEVPGATGYRVYKGVSPGVFTSYFPATTNTYTDTGTAGTNGTPPVEQYRAFLCLTSNGFDGSTDSISTDSKCSGDWADSLPGVSSWTMSGEANAIGDGVTSSQANEDEAFDLWATKTPVWAAIFNPALAKVRKGIVYISSYSEAYPNNAAATYNITLTGKGRPVGTPSA